MSVPDKIDEVIARLDRLEELLEARLPKRKKPMKKANPTYAEVRAYAEERGRVDLSKQFFDNYTAGKNKTEQWLKSDGRPVYNWKCTFNTWCKNTPSSNSQFGLGEIG